LDVAPAAVFSAAGMQGGTFAPTAQMFTLTNKGAAPVDWAISGIPMWLDVAPSAGAGLPVDGAADLTASLASAAVAALSPGLYYTNLVFTDTATGNHAVRGCRLTVLERLDIAPETAFAIEGPEGGPFCPTSRSYTVTNLAEGSVAWSVTAPAWLDASPSSSAEAGGPLSLNESASVSVVLNTGAAEAMGAGAYADVIIFSNDTYGSTVEREAVLRVRNIVYVDQAATGAETGSSWADAFTSVQDGIDAAAAAKSGATPWVWVAKGIYFEAVMMADGIEVYGGFCSGDTAMADQEPEANETTLDGDNSYTPVTFDETTGAVLDGFTVRNGFSMASGGGICCMGADDSNAIRRCVVRENKTGRRGSGIYLGGASTIGVSDCWIIGNVHIGLGEFDGGLMCDQDADAIIRNCLICANFGRFGAGVGCILSSPTLINCIISGNIAATLDVNPDNSKRHGSGGGGVFAHNGASPRLESCIISGNYAVNWGAGALYCQGHSNPVLNNCTIAHNSAYHVDDLYNQLGGVVVNNGSCPTLTNCLIAGTAYMAIYEEHDNSNVQVINCLFEGNGGADFRNQNDGANATYTGGHRVNINVDGASGNLLGNPAPLFVMGASGVWSEEPLYDQANNVTRLTATGAPFAGMSLKGRLINPDTSQTRQALIMANTADTVDVLTDLRSSSADGYIDIGDGFVLIDYHVGVDSPCRDAGDDSVVGPNATDLEGRERRAGAAVDIGAYETASGPVFTLEPIGATRYLGQACTFTAAARNGDRPITYQWFRNGEPLEGATSPTLELASLSLDNAGVYTCQATDDTPATTSSNEAELVLLDAAPITITGQPAGATVYRTQSHTFSVTAVPGYGALSYLWLKDGEVIEDAAGANLTIDAAALADAGSYSCLVRDAMGLGWTPFQGHFYRLTPTGMPWGDAEAWALTQGAHLVGISSEAENAFVHTAFGSASRWIGYNDGDWNGIWTWTDGEPAVYENWADGEPNYAGGVEWVAHMRSDGLWNDLVHTAAYYGVVETDALGAASDTAALTVLD
ncbi:MAG TPA: hypothetical protein ENN80_03715, partial [Candidatus Hydrogenedentes bacterium]|nr:hypothetical protein [Candidatus Hydrogenedentota bacterium]